MNTDPASAQWLQQHTTPTTRYTRTATSLNEAVNCWVYNHNTPLLFAALGRKIRVILTDDTVDLIREDFNNWRDAIHFAQGILATYRQPH